MAKIEFLVPQRPVSCQAKNKKNKRAWMSEVAARANAAWAGQPAISSGPLRLTIVYLADPEPADVDNIIKPIQDAMVGVVYVDDSLVSDVDSHLRPRVGTFDPLALPATLLDGVGLGHEAVYVCVQDALPLEDYL